MVDEDQLRADYPSISPDDLILVVVYPHEGVDIPRKNVRCYQVTRDTLWNIGQGASVPTYIPDVPPPATQTRQVVISVPLRIRADHTTASAQIGVLAAGATVSVVVGNEFSDTTRRWLKLAMRDGWIAEDFTHAVNPNLPPVIIPTTGGARFGINFVGPGAPHSIESLASVFANAGKIMGPFVAINEWKALVIRAWLRVFRVKSQGRAEPDPLELVNGVWVVRRTVEQWFEDWYPSLSPALSVSPDIYLGFHNELVWSPDNIRLRIAWESAFMRFCAAKNIHITYGNFRVLGFSEDMLGDLVPMVRLGRDLGHILRGNTYLYKDRSASEQRRILTYMLPLARAVPDAPWFLGEYGWALRDAAYPGDLALPELLDLHAELFSTNVGNYQGNALWCKTLAKDWEHSNIPDSADPIIVRAST